METYSEFSLTRSRYIFSGNFLPPPPVARRDQSGKDMHENMYESVWMLRMREPQQLWDDSSRWHIPIKSILNCVYFLISPFAITKFYVEMRLMPYATDTNCNGNRHTPRMRLCAALTATIILLSAEKAVCISTQPFRLQPFIAQFTSTKRWNRYYCLPFSIYMHITLHCEWIYQKRNKRINVQKALPIKKANAQQEKQSWQNTNVQNPNTHTHSNKLIQWKCAYARMSWHFTITTNIYAVC